MAWDKDVGKSAVFAHGLLFTYLFDSLFFVCLIICLHFKEKQMAWKKPTSWRLITCRLALFAFPLCLVDDQTKHARPLAKHIEPREKERGKRCTNSPKRLRLRLTHWMLPVAPGCFRGDFDEWSCCHCCYSCCCSAGEIETFMLWCRGSHNWLNLKSSTFVLSPHFTSAIAHFLWNVVTQLIGDT